MRTLARGVFADIVPVAGGTAEPSIQRRKSRGAHPGADKSGPGMVWGGHCHGTLWDTEYVGVEPVTHRTAESEKAVEAYLVKRMREIGGRAYKWVSPGNDGVPDRMCIFPGGRVELAELKGAGGRVSRLQAHRFAELSGMGRRVWVLWSRDSIDRFIEEVLAGAQA